MQPFDSDAQFLGKALLPAIFGLPTFAQNNMLKILDSLGVTDPDPEAWYSINIMTAFYKEIATDFGPNTIFDLGKAIPDNAVFPPGIDSIENGLNLIDIAYNMNHKGYVGFYKMVSHDLERKEIVMQCYNPYPCNFDRGLFTAMARKFKTGIRVVLDETKPHKAQGGDESSYLISYR